MTCPFASFASTANLSPSEMALISSYHTSYLTPTLQHVSSSLADITSKHPPLSEHLKNATAKAHREIESSAGVRKLMGFGKGGSEDDDGKVFGRLDYIRWLIILGCIYATLESCLVDQDASDTPMLKPLLQAEPPSRNPADSSSSSSSSSSSPPSSSLLPHLLRLPAILRDIDTHLRILARSSSNEEGAGLDWAELVEESIDQIGSEDKVIYDELARCLSLTSQSDLIALANPSLSAASQITSEHLHLLSVTEAEATLRYVQRLQTLSDRESSLLLPHAYVRYLGDLSGGQHIRKRVSKLFPLDDEARAALLTSSAPSGCDFYDFPKRQDYADASDAEWHRCLKDAFRVAMDSGIPHTARLHVFLNTTSRNAVSVDDLVSSLLTAHGSEASLAFELNKDLFEGLIGVRPTTIVGPIPKFNPTNSSTTSSVLGDETETDTDFSSSSAAASTCSGSSASSSCDGDSPRVGKEEHSLFAKHLRLALLSTTSSSSSSSMASKQIAIELVAKESQCPISRAKRAIATASPLIATTILVLGSAVLLKAALSA